MNCLIQPVPHFWKPACFPGRWPCILSQPSVRSAGLFSEGQGFQLPKPSNHRFSWSQRCFTSCSRKAAQRPVIDSGLWDSSCLTVTTCDTNVQRLCWRMPASVWLVKTTQRGLGRARSCAETAFWFEQAAELHCRCSQNKKVFRGSFSNLGDGLWWNQIVLWVFWEKCKSN